MTLTEVMIVVVVMGVMAALAVPNYFNTVEEGRANEARVNLNVIRTAEEVFRLGTGQGRYPNGTFDTTGKINKALSTDVASRFYNLTLRSGPTLTFTATATRNSNNYARTFTINQTNTCTDSRGGTGAVGAGC